MGGLTELLVLGVEWLGAHKELGELYEPKELHELQRSFTSYEGTCVF